VRTHRITAFITQQVTKLAYSQVSRYGMSEEVGTISFAFAESDGERLQVDKPYSQKTARLIDDVRVPDEPLTDALLPTSADPQPLSAHPWQM
jgi:ATP-dependent Zn protease